MQGSWSFFVKKFFKESFFGCAIESVFRNSNLSSCHIKIRLSFRVPSTVRSFIDRTPVYCPLRRTPSGIEPGAVAWQSITLPLRHASSIYKIQLHADNTTHGCPQYNTIQITLELLKANCTATNKIIIPTHCFIDFLKWWLPLLGGQSVPEGSRNPVVCV